MRADLHLRRKFWEKGYLTRQVKSKMRELGKDLEKEIVQHLESGTQTGRMYVIEDRKRAKPKGRERRRRRKNPPKYRASRPGEVPAERSGKLKRSFTTEVDEDNYRVKLIPKKTAPRVRTSEGKLLSLGVFLQKHAERDVYESVVRRFYKDKFIPGIAEVIKESKRK